METSYLIKLLKEISDIMAENKDKLIEMDGIVGDGDLGLTMSDGFKAAYDAVSDGAIADAGKLLFAAGKAMANKVPSTMGSLMATGLKQAGKDLKGKETLEDADVVQIFASYEAGVAKLGEAKVGDKTFLDGLHPAVESLQASLAAGESLADMAGKAADAAEEGFKATTTMLAVHGRAATRGEASRSLEDPGAKVASLIMQAFANLVGLGGAPRAGIKLGEGKADEANRIFHTAFCLLVLLGVVIGAAAFCFARQIVLLFGCPESAVEFAVSYLKIYACGTIFVMLAQGLNPFILTQGYSWLAMSSVLLGALINIALDPLFIFTFKMGVQGSSLATILSQLCSCIWIVCFFFSRKSLFRFQASLLGLSPGRIFSILSLGFTPFIMTLTECAIQIVFNINLNRATGGNKDYTAALTVMLSALQLISLPLNGLGNGMQPFVSYNYGKADSARLKQGIKYVTIIAFIYAVCIWSVSMAFPVVYARLFSASEAVTQIVKRYTPMFLMGSIMFFVQMTLQNVNVGLGQAKEALLLAVNRKVVILIPLCFVLTHFLGFKGVYLSEGIADLIAGIITAIVIFSSFPKIFRRREEEVKQAASN